MPNDFLVYPDRPDIFDRAPLKPEYERQYFREGAMAQGAELNELGTRQDTKRARVGNLIARDGDRVSGAGIVVTDIGTGTYDLGAGEVYLRGDVREIAAATLTGVSTSGDVQIGIRITEDVIDHEDDPDLLGQYEGAASYGEAGSVRVKYTLEWGWSGDGGSGALYAVYALRDGQVVDQAPPPELSGVSNLIAAYDYGAHENYIDEGCRVTALGKVGDAQVFSIGEGIANILGYKRYRNTATRYEETEEPDIEQVNSEPHTLDDNGGTAVIAVNHTPVNGVVTCIIEKEFTETINRGGVADTADALSNPSVTEIITVYQDPTTFVADTDYVLTADSVDWSPGGAEPAGGSSYDVTYRYLAAVAPEEITDTAITVAGGVDGGQAFVTYTFKLPRIDRICLDRAGNVVYLKGVAAREQPHAPLVPQTLLSLCEVKNDWFSTPIILNTGIKNYPFWLIDRMFRSLLDLYDLASLERLRRDISAREPTAKHRVFVDPFTSDRYRDAGEAQDASVFDGTCQITIDPDFHLLSLAGPATLDFGTEIILRQDLVTGCQKINPYQAFSPLPLAVSITPSEDFWEITNVTWLSPVTRVFGRGSLSRNFSALNDGVSGTQDGAFQGGDIQTRITTDLIETTSSSAARFLREIEVDFMIGNLGNGETVNVLTFDGVDVNPGGLAGDVNGQATGSFVIPASVAVGVKEVYVEGASGTRGTARFEGRGIVTDVVRQRINNVARQTPSREAGERGGDQDPVAQTFLLSESRHIAGIDVKFCAIGDRDKPVVCEIVEVDNGVPTRNVIAQTEVDMNLVVANTWHRFAFDVPPFIAEGKERAFVFKTDDPAHSLSVAKRGGFDQASQKWVGAQPYTVGVLLSSSNARTWTAHQDEDLTMRIIGAVFEPSKVIALGTVPVTQLSDLICAANVVLPTEQTSIRFRVTPDGQGAQLLENGQNWERDDFFTGNVTVEAVLSGASTVSPVLGKDTLAVAGTMRASGTYVSRLFEMGTAVQQDARIKTRIPTGAGLTVEVDAGDDNWQAMTMQDAEALADGSLDRLYRKAGWTAADGGRIRLTMTGTPAARPVLADLRSFSI